MENRRGVSGDTQFAYNSMVTPSTATRSCFHRPAVQVEEAIDHELPSGPDDPQVPILAPFGRGSVGRDPHRIRFPFGSVSRFRAPSGRMEGGGIPRGGSWT